MLHAINQVLAFSNRYLLPLTAISFPICVHTAEEAEKDEMIQTALKCTEIGLLLGTFLFASNAPYLILHGTMKLSVLQFGVQSLYFFTSQGAVVGMGLAISKYIGSRLPAA